MKWVATEDGSAGNGTGRHIAQFVLEAGGEKNKNVLLTKRKDEMQTELPLYGT